MHNEYAQQKITCPLFNPIAPSGFKNQSSAPEVL